MAVKPLTIAIAAMVLLVSSVAFEVVFQRTYTLEVRHSFGWQPIGTSQRETGSYEPTPAREGLPITAARNASIEFRLLVDNGYPWAFSERYYAQVSGVTVADGMLEAKGRSVGEAAFTIPAATLFASTGSKPEANSNLTFPNVYVQVGREYVGGSFQLQEVS